jgi:hypothetical protein
MSNLFKNLFKRNETDETKSDALSSGVAEMEIRAGDFDDSPLQISIQSNDGCSLISVIPPVGGQVRTPCDICCVVDVSGSMSSPATMNSGADTENHGFSVLDIVKHALRTIIHTLNDADRIAVVSYSSTAKEVCGLTLMNYDGKTAVSDAVDKLAPGGQTNIWDGLLKGMEILRSSSSSGRFACLMLLTDGLPNIIPPEGHLLAVQRYRDQYQSLPCRINTFGFGYNLDSPLLHELAVEGSGMYSFIPDCSFVGTIFVNSLSMMLSTVATDAKLSIEPTNGTYVSEILGGYPSQSASWGHTVELGSIGYGQSKNIVLRVNIPELDDAVSYLSVTLKYTHVLSGASREISEEGKGKHISDSPLINEHKFRLLAVSCIRTAIENCKSQQYDAAMQLVQSTISEIKRGNPTPFLTDLLADLEGQVSEAISRKDYFEKWGKHYLFSLMQAHLLQVCNNFKDPGVQHYGGELFVRIRDIADEAFSQLPPPKPSLASSRTTNVSTMAAYNSAANPCFAGHCLVRMKDETLKRVDSVRAGDIVNSGLKKDSKVTCVVKTVPFLKKATLVHLEGLAITPYHPIKRNGKWVFPCEVGNQSNVPCEALYSFVLDNHHVMTINDTECVTLGHDFEDDVRRHPYFGSNLVIEDLKKFSSWNSGLVELVPQNIVRDANGLICGITN